VKFLNHLLLRIFKKGYDLYWKSKYDEYLRIYQIDKTFRFNGTNILFYGNGMIKCGCQSYIGNYSTIQVGEGSSVVIGDCCSISHNVRIYTRTTISDQDFTKRPLKKRSGDVIIGNGVWIGANVFINPGIKIGANSIIGANSVVTKDILSNAIYGGVPAKLIRFKNIDDSAD
jgi:maltose O-acetyltransferase